MAAAGEPEALAIAAATVAAEALPGAAEASTGEEENGASRCCCCCPPQRRPRFACISPCWEARTSRKGSSDECSAFFSFSKQPAWPARGLTLGQKRRRVSCCRLLCLKPPLLFLLLPLLFFFIILSVVDHVQLHIVCPFGVCGFDDGLEHGRRCKNRTRR